MSKSIDQYHMLQAYADRALAEDNDKPVQAVTVGLAADAGRILAASETPRDDALMAQGISLEITMQRVRDANPDIDQRSFALGALTAMLYVQHGYTGALTDITPEQTDESS